MTETQVSYGNLLELSKHNRAQEEQARNELVELSRHNKVGENYNMGQLAELVRHNQATESESHRSNLMNEYLKELANQISLTSAQIAASGRIQAAGINAAASKFIASLTNHSNLVATKLNNASREEIARLNNLASTIMSDNANAISQGNLDLNKLKQEFAKDTFAYNVIFGKDGLADMPNKISDALGVDYLGSAAGKAIGNAN